MSRCDDMPILRGLSPLIFDETLEKLLEGSATEMLEIVVAAAFAAAAECVFD